MRSITTYRAFHGLVAVLAVGAAMWGLSPSFAGPEDGKEASAKVLTRLDEEWSAAAATRDVERVSSFYAEDAITYPPNEPAAVGRAAAKKIWATMLADPTFVLAWKAVHAEVSRSGELGYTAGTYEASSKGPDGKQVIEKGKYLCTWKLQKDGTWKAIHDMWNADSK